VSDPAVSCNIDLTAPGKHVGRLAFPKITNTAGWASTFVHIASIGNGEGPTVLVLAGNHGDDEGQVAALRLLQELQPEQVTGRVIVIPSSPPPPRRRIRATGRPARTSTAPSPGTPTGHPTNSSRTTSRACSSPWPTS
jgi:predicted deacylase